MDNKIFNAGHRIPATFVSTDNIVCYRFNNGSRLFRKLAFDVFVKSIPRSDFGAMNLRMLVLLGYGEYEMADNVVSDRIYLFRKKKKLSYRSSFDEVNLIEIS